MPYRDPERTMAELQARKLRSIQDLIIRANNDPRSLSQDQLETAMNYGQQMGIDMSPMKEKDIATKEENLAAAGIGVLDSLAFGLVPDRWYTNYRTKGASNVGKLAGTVASLAIPGGIFAGKGSKKILDGAYKAATAKKTAAKEVIKNTDLLLKNTDDALKTVTKLGKQKDKIEASLKVAKTAKQKQQLTNQYKKVSNAWSAKIAESENLNKQYQAAKELLSKPSWGDTPIKELFKAGGEGANVWKGAANAFKGAGNLTPKEILELAKTITQGTRFVRTMYDYQTSNQINPYELNMYGMPQQQGMQ